MLVREALFVGVGFGAEAETGPWEAAGGLLARDLFVGVGGGGGAGAAEVECACGVVVPAAGCVREGVVGVVYLLEFLGAGGAFGGVGGDAVGVRFECCSGLGERRISSVDLMG